MDVKMLSRRQLLITALISSDFKNFYARISEECSLYQQKDSLETLLKNSIGESGDFDEI